MKLGENVEQLLQELRGDLTALALLLAWQCRQRKRLKRRQRAHRPPNGPDTIDQGDDDLPDHRGR